MELNEIKSQLASLMNFGKISVSSGAGSDAFAQMLNNGTEAERPEVRENDRAAAAAEADRSTAVRFIPLINPLLRTKKTSRQKTTTGKRTIRLTLLPAAL